jgi:5-aminopentanamidase
VTRIAAVSCDPQIADLEANRRLTAAAIRATVRAGAELIVLPELVTSGYVFTSREEAASVALAADDALFGEWSRLAGAGPSVVIGGFCEHARDGTLFNSAIAVDGDGVLAVYRKTHLWDREKLVFAAGDEEPPVLDTPVGRVGMLICYDLEFPEMTRALALRGAEVIAVPTNWPLVERPADEHPPEVIAAMAPARANRVFIACADRSGVERGIRFTGGTSLIDESGWVLAETREAGMACADADLARARAKAIGDRNHAFDDRRPELYGDVLRARSEAATSV